MKTKKKGPRRILVLSQSRISDFLSPSGYYLLKKRGGQTDFASFSVRPEEAPSPPHPKIDAYTSIEWTEWLYNRNSYSMFKFKQNYTRKHIIFGKDFKQLLSQVILRLNQIFQYSVYLAIIFLVNSA